MKAYLIPGFMEDRKSRDYDAVLSIYKKADYEPVFVPIDWKYKTVDDWVEQVKSRLSQKDIEGSLLSGFSFGAVTALSLAGYYQPPTKLLLFSLSCYYAEDQKRIPGWWLAYIGKHRAEAFNRIDFNDLASRITCPTQVFLGSKEDPEMFDRAHDAKSKIKNSRLIIAQGAKHDVAAPEYLGVIESVIQE